MNICTNANKWRLRPYFRASFKEPVWNTILWWGIVWWTLRDDEGFRFINPSWRSLSAESTPILYNNFREKVVLKDVADFVGQNPTSLCRYFKKSTDKSIFQVLAEIRIEYACKLLANSDLTITEVAFSSGYNTPTLFFEQFQKIIHFTPAEYRREINGVAKLSRLDEEHLQKWKTLQRYTMILQTYRTLLGGKVSNFAPSKE